MLGAIIGDTIGSIFEFSPVKVKNFPLFGEHNEITDDSILTMAVFSALEKCEGNYTNLSHITAKELIKWYAIYPEPMGGYGGGFANWAATSLQTYRIMPPYNSYGNGAAMRVSPVAYFAESLEHCIELSRKVTRVTHNHPEGIKGAEATSVAIYMALHGKTRREIEDHIKTHYYPLNENCNNIRKYYHFEPSCQKTVPQSIKAFLESSCYEDAIRISISLGGDADTMGAITGAIAEAYFGIPKKLENKILSYLDERCKAIVLKMIERRNRVVKRYEENDEPLFKPDLVHSRVTGSNMDGFPDPRQSNCGFQFKGTLFQCKNAMTFSKINENNIETPMNENEFQFFIDEIRTFLHKRFKGQINSVEDFFSTLLLKMSRNYWKE